MAISWMSTAAFWASIPAAIGSVIFWLEVAATRAPAAAGRSAAPPISSLSPNADQAQLNAVLRDQAEFSTHAAFWVAVTLFLQTLSTALKFIPHLGPQLPFTM